jgi:plasmid stability protein
MPATTEVRGLKLVRLELPYDVQKQFRVEAAKEGMSMAAMARRVVEEWVAKRTKGAK